MALAANTQRTVGQTDALGHYSPRRAGTLAGVSGYTIGQWARYGLISPSAYEGRPINLYTFFDVAEAFVVHWLRDQEFSYSEIHQAIDSARKDHPAWPLLHSEVGVAKHADATVDRGVIVQRLDRSYVETGRAGGQVILHPDFLALARDHLASGGWFAKELGLERIEVDPAKLGGAPTLEGRRWPVERVAAIASDREGRELLVADYGLSLAEIEESVQFAHAAAGVR